MELIRAIVLLGTMLCIVFRDNGNARARALYPSHIVHSHYQLYSIYGKLRYFHYSRTLQKATAQRPYSYTSWFMHGPAMSIADLSLLYTSDWWWHVECSSLRKRSSSTASHWPCRPNGSRHIQIILNLIAKVSLTLASDRDEGTTPSEAQDASKYNAVPQWDGPCKSSRIVRSTRDSVRSSWNGMSVLCAK